VSISSRPTPREHWAICYSGQS